MMKNTMDALYENYGDLFSSLPIGYAFLGIVYDFNNEPCDCRFLEINKIFEEKIELSSEDLIGNNISQLFKYFAGKKAEEILSYVIKTINTNKQHELDVYNDKINKWYKIFFNSPNNDFLVLYLIDITKEKLHMIELENSRRRLENIIEATNVGTWEINIKTGERAYNERWAGLLGYTLEELSPIDENTWKSLVHPDDLQVEYAKDVLLYNKEIKSYDSEYRMRHKDGRWIWIQDIGKVISWTADGEPLLLSGTHADVTAKRNEREKALNLSYRDQLTGFYNRRYFEDNLKNIDVESNLPLSVIVADVNGLKLINDSFGHDAGDKLITATSEIIKNGCRNNDIIIRTGGDEFLLILPNTNSKQTAKIIKRMNSLASGKKINSVEISISYGCKIKTKMNEKFINVFKEAEADMYRHKLYKNSATRNKTIKVIIKALYEKSNREIHHSANVGELCRDIALKLNFSKEKAEQIKLAGIMHDIGKIGISENILNKMHRLNYDEYNEIKRHPEIGYRILSTSNDYSEIAEYVLKHHERWDGKGYPGGFKGEEICIQARIIAVAEAYDDMINNESYKHCLSVEKAVNELKLCSGTQFDPNVVKILIEIIKERSEREV